MLEYGLMNRAGFTVITGDIGCGKTSLIRHLLDQLDKKFTLGLISNTHPSLGDLLEWVLVAFGIEGGGNRNIERFRIFRDFVIEEHAKNRCVILIIDEAQNLDVSMLEELRLLWNVNVDKHSVLQLILVGQPDLRTRLCRAELVKLSQRVAVDFHLGPLSPTETKAYIQHRVRVAGGKVSIFRQNCFDVIHRYTRGVPRSINLLCDTALVYAYAQNRKTVNAEMIREVLRDKLRSGFPMLA
jgi:type II secretory pathway predicted ATPase ExeA